MDRFDEMTEELKMTEEREEARRILLSKKTLFDMVHFYEQNKRPPKIETGIPQLDQHLGGGIEVGQLIGIGGEPEAGKSMMLERIIDNVAEGYRVMYYTLEFSPREYAEKYTKTLNVRHKNILVDPETYFIDEIEKEVNLLSAHENVKFIVIDSQMKLGHKELTTPDSTNDIFRRLKNMARINELILFIIVQSSKEDHKSKSKGVYGSMLAEHELNQYWFLSSDKTARETVIEFKKNKQNGRYSPVVIKWKPEVYYAD